MEKKSKLKTGYSCTKQLLRDWSHREDANLLNLVSALNRLGHVTAIHILLGSHLSCCTAKSGALPSFVGHCCTSARSTNGTVPWLISLKQPFGGDIVWLTRIEGGGGASRSLHNLLDYGGTFLFAGRCLNVSFASVPQTSNQVSDVVEKDVKRCNFVSCRWTCWWIALLTTTVLMNCHWIDSWADLN